MNPLAAAAKDLMALGVTGDALVAALNRMEQAVYIDPIKGVDPIAEKRRAYDRERKRDKKAKTEAESGGIPVESTESTEQAESTRPLPSSPPEPPQLPTPTRENITTRARGTASDRANGKRLPDDWLPGWTYAVHDFGLSQQEHAAELDKFRDYWRGVPGGSGRKLDWDATWRNWMRRASNDLARRKPNVRTGPTAKFEQRHENYRDSFAGAEIAIGRRALEPQGGF